MDKLCATDDKLQRRGLQCSRPCCRDCYRFEKKVGKNLKNVPDQTNFITLDVQAPMQGIFAQNISNWICLNFPREFFQIEFNKCWDTYWNISFKFSCQGAKYLCLCLFLLGIFLMTVLMSSKDPSLQSSAARVSRKSPDPVSGSLKSLQSLEMVQTEALLDGSLSSPQSNQELYRLGDCLMSMCWRNSN